jgi:Na+/H+ antiporter NhaD/arsenite permease-like protein
MSSSNDTTESHARPRLWAKTFAGFATVSLMACLLLFVLNGGHHAPGNNHAPPAGSETAAHADNSTDIDLNELESSSAEHAETPALWGFGILPFILILGCIAILPLIPATEHWWESNLSRYIVSIGLAALTLIYVWLTADEHPMHKVGAVLDHALLLEYVPFIMLLFSLYVISGGIQLSGDIPAHPMTNTTYLAVGALIASFIGTTGASMLLIRPLLNTNRERKHKIHTIVMFIFLVSNIGGSLLPIGDPPLFLGYLAGVPFFWTFTLWGPWLFTCILLLVIYFVWDTIMYRRESPAAIAFDETNVQPLRLRGLINIPWLLGVIVCVAFVNPDNPIPGTHWHPFEFAREGLMLMLVAISLLTTPRGIRKANQYNYHAIFEVAALFVGIFITMQIPIEVLKAHGGAITAEFNEPWMYFWLTGGLSSVLDNAPTYLVFFNLAQTSGASEGVSMLGLSGGGSIPVDSLIAISLGAVFMGSMTYIGNGPNFMVKAIAEQSGVKMPSFIGYVFKYSIPVLIPVLILVVLVFMVL